MRSSFVHLARIEYNGENGISNEYHMIEINHFKFYVLWMMG
jgi:hypothetical protein